MCRSIFRFFPLGTVLIVRDRWFYCKVKEEKVDERYISLKGIPAGVAYIVEAADGERKVHVDQSQSYGSCD